MTKVTYDHCLCTARSIENASETIADDDEITNKDDGHHFSKLVNMQYKL